MRGRNIGHPEVHRHRSVLEDPPERGARAAYVCNVCVVAYLTGRAPLYERLPFPEALTRVVMLPTAPARSSAVRRDWSISLVVAVLLFVVPAAPGQTLDERGLRAVYGWEHPALVAPIRAAEYSAYPVFLAAAPGVAAWERWGRTTPTYARSYRMALSEAGALVGYYGLKRLIRRPRPASVLADVPPKSALGERELRVDPYSFPSGHATFAFAVATSLSLSYPEWYVVVPAYVWASAVALSRVWLGMHYPSDVLGGAVLGAGVAGAVHLLWPEGRGGEEPGGVTLFLVRTSW